jgi:tetratricopeptide (TPR) repeat protein
MMAAFALLVVNSAYLGTVSLASRATGRPLENTFTIWMFLGHLVLGTGLAIPFLWFVAGHLRRAIGRPNRSAVRAGLATAAAGIATIVTGILLTRIEFGGRVVTVEGPEARSWIMWMHIAAPAAMIWMFLLHRLAGPRIRWRAGVGWSAIAVTGAAAMVGLHWIDPRGKDSRAPQQGASYFEPSLVRTAHGDFLTSDSLMRNDYCLECHADVHASWARSAHAASSFNNPMYAFSVRETRRRAFAREGSVKDANFCAGCHDPVPFLSGAFEDTRWDDPDYDAAHDPMGSASITCVACHAITEVGVRGNADFTIAEPAPYPFESADGGIGAWLNRQLVKARPSLHARTYLKPEVHRSAEFCSTCHKVFLPEPLNDYRWMRGQNHYDSFRLSGWSGFGVQSWRWPPRAESSCNGCHMPAHPSGDFGSKPRGPDGALAALSHSFAAANTAMPMLADLPDAERTVAECEASLAKSMRVDILGVRSGGTVDGPLVVSPTQSDSLRPASPHVLEIVVRNLAVGHAFTEGTADSNEVWLEVAISDANGRVLAQSGKLSAGGEVNPWSKFFNSFVIDRDGQRIERRNVQDIFVTMYSNQVPAGAADVTHYSFDTPATEGPIAVRASLKYRKFDATYWREVYGADRRNDLPVTTVAQAERVMHVGASAVGGDVVVAGVHTGSRAEADVGAAAASGGSSDRPSRGAPAGPSAAERWYDYGIALFRQGERGTIKGDLRQADDAFSAAATHATGDAAALSGAAVLGRARTALKEGRLDDARTHLIAASGAAMPAWPWAVRYWSGVLNRQNGALDEAIADFDAVLASAFPSAAERGFDFGRDERVAVSLGETLLERARRDRVVAESDESVRARTRQDAERARTLAERALAADPESVSAWYLLAQASTELGDTATADRAMREHGRYRVDDNARDRAIRLARERYPAAARAADPITLYTLSPVADPVP